MAAKWAGGVVAVVAVLDDDRGGGSVSYENCAAVRAAGADPRRCRLRVSRWALTDM